MHNLGFRKQPGKKRHHPLEMEEGCTELHTKAETNGKRIT